MKTAAPAIAVARIITLLTANPPPLVPPLTTAGTRLNPSQRAERNLYVSAEYRWEVWTFVDFSLFFDAGKVFSDVDDFNFDKMHTGYGIGLRIHAPGGMAFRMDVANSTEGLKFHISGGPTF